MVAQSKLKELNASSSTLRIETPEAFVPLLQSKRFKGAKGGRGAAKSNFFAETLIEETLMGHVRAACIREVQSSIRDSVKTLIEDKIEKFGLSHLFRITDREITGPNDSLYIFRGLQNHTAASIKSLEGFNRGWVEEAQTITQRSLDLLIPTFRKGSELSFSWNPDKETDPVDQHFSQNVDDPDFVCVHVNYDSNPWFPDELRRDMERDKIRDPDKYAHVWLGQYQKNSESRVFKNWKIEAFETPANAVFYFGADWGFSVDPTTLVRCWISGRTLYVDRECYRVGCEIDNTPQLFDAIDPDIPEMARKWVIRADSARPETISYMQRHGYPKIESAQKGPSSVMDGIEFLKSYDIVVHPRCKHVIDELSFYSFKIDKKTLDILPILEDKKNHVIDALRYALEGLRNARQSEIKPLRLW